MIHALSSVLVEAVSLPMEAQLTLLLVTLGSPVGSCGCKGRKHQTSQHQWWHQTLPKAWLALSSVHREVASLSGLSQLIWDIIFFSALAASSLLPCSNPACFAFSLGPPTLATGPL